MEQPSTALVTTTENNATEIYRRMPDPMQAIEKMGQMFAASGMFGCTKVEQGQVLALACLIEGKSPFELMRNYHIIGGSLAMRSVGMLAEFIKRSGKVTWHSALNDGTTADATFEFNGQTLQRAAYTIKDAEKEGLVNGSKSTTLPRKWRSICASSADYWKRARPSPSSPGRLAAGFRRTWTSL
jgi:hypothetical protein